MRKRFVDVAYAFFFQHLWLLTGLCLLTTLVGVLWGCIHNGHLPPEFPSPSDTGVFQPEVPPSLLCKPGLASIRALNQMSRKSMPLQKSDL
jgi:hypothetical protein